ncbi:MAG: hypothetical protein BWY75_01391 [bacterium ADurb.Bin425]|nr:MAG: hypothetical protein BWY75_01391 [bacterium ADurb.Bin425]
MQVTAEVPSGVVSFGTGSFGFFRHLLKFFELTDASLKIALFSENANICRHYFVQFFCDIIRVDTVGTLKWSLHFIDGFFNLPFVNLRMTSESLYIICGT